ncbi:uncharacterized protein BKA78DRAFT_311713 [Phyllosticta capitalensis]|uniref:Uncharacterized protein n=1 Tax=Phyllosticta capitalensis TaxID=121624 RepID=A0ABR1YW11_9PEZI
MAPVAKGFVSGVMSSILSPKKNKKKNQDKSKSEDEGFVDVSESDTFIDSDYDSDHDFYYGKPLMGMDSSMIRTFQKDTDSDEEITLYDSKVYSSKRHFSYDEEITSDDDLDPEDAPMPIDFHKGLFAKFDQPTKIEDEFEHIHHQEAEGSDNGRAARLNAAMKLVRRKAELRKADSSPEQLRCYCLVDDKNGWKKCPSKAHQELGELMNTT